MGDIDRLTRRGDTRPFVEYHVWQCDCGFISTPSEDETFHSIQADDHRETTGCPKHEGWLYTISRGRTREFNVAAPASRAS